MGDDTSANSGSGRGSESCFRIYGHRNLEFEDQFRIFRKQEEIRPVVAKIARIHDEARAEKLDNDDLCFGLFDPATNILVNSIISGSEGAPPPLPTPPRAYAGRRRRRREWEEDLDDDDDDDSRARAFMAQRSFDGLVAFLTALFPYLPDAEALAYLDAAELDPLVAALLIIGRRGMRDHFDLCSPVTVAAAEVALRCAAAAAKHPDPRWLVQAWKKVLLLLVPAPPPNGPQPEAVRRALKLDAVAPDLLQLKGAWDLAKGRLAAAAAPPKELLPPVRAAMKRMLLATIHGLYVQALGRLPTAELRSRYHRSLLIGGYCYGPLDPVSNIIVNAVWYEHNSPASKQVSVSMVSTSMLWRVAARSLFALITFLCARYPDLTPDQAVQCLLMTGADLQAADANLSRDSRPASSASADEESSTRVASVVEAYTAAATAAFHSFPDTVPPAHPEFLAHHQGWVGSALEVLQAARNSGPLSSQDMSSLEMVLERTSKSHHQQHDTAPTMVKNVVYHHMSLCSHRFWGKHERVTAMVREALDRFNKTDAEGRLFELHIIFGFNELVSGPVHCVDGGVGDYNPWTRDKYYHTHINFLAICKDRPYDPPTIFFAECGKDGADTCWCVPIILPKPKSGQPRCVYCEHRANRIVHPDVKSFYGRDEFDKLFYESDRKFYNNDRAIKHTKLDINWVHHVKDDAVYLNYNPDGDDGDEADWIQIS